MSTSPLRLVCLAPDPLGLYVRAGRLDQKDLQSFITSGSVAFTGVVFEAKRVGQQKELLSLVLERGLDAVLDPQTQAMGTVGGYARGMDGLPWSKKRPHALADLATTFQQRQLAEDIAKFIVLHGFTQAITPTHLIRGGRGQGTLCLRMSGHKLQPPRNRRHAASSGQALPLPAHAASRRLGADPGVDPPHRIPRRPPAAGKRCSVDRCQACAARGLGTEGSQAGEAAERHADHAGPLRQEAS